MRFRGSKQCQHRSRHPELDVPPRVIRRDRGLERCNSRGRSPATIGLMRSRNCFGYHYCGASVLACSAIAFPRRLTAGAAPAFTVVLFGSMLWTHFEAAGAALNMTPHVDGPANGDVVIVTDEPVIVALIGARITPQAARELGLMRFYGSPDTVRDVTRWLDRLSYRRASRRSASGHLRCSGGAADPATFRALHAAKQIDVDVSRFNLKSP